MKTALVVTSINLLEPFLQSYALNLQDHGHLADVTFYVIPDLSTPGAVHYEIEHFRRLGLHIEFPVPDVQDGFLRQLGLRTDFIPYHSDNRRNVGYLMALRDGYDYLISLDDDNLCPPLAGDWLNGHLAYLQSTKPHLPMTEGKWHNPCGTDKHFSRGFPYFARPDYHISYEYGRWGDALKIGCNQGLWRGAPDIDAISWLNTKCDFSGREWRGTFALASETWAPINSQNTSILHDCIPAYYFLQSPRFGDIYQGYFLLACLKQLGWTVRYGTPITDHKRNSHNYLKDIAHELPDIRTLESFLPILTESKLEGSTISDAYSSLISIVAEHLSPTMADSMAQWLAACHTIGV